MLAHAPENERIDALQASPRHIGHVAHPIQVIGAAQRLIKLGQEKFQRPIIGEAGRSNVANPSVFRGQDETFTQTILAIVQFASETAQGKNQGVTPGIVKQERVIKPKIGIGDRTMAQKDLDGYPGIDCADDFFSGGGHYGFGALFAHSSDNSSKIIVAQYGTGTLEPSLKGTDFIASNVAPRDVQNPFAPGQGLGIPRAIQGLVVFF